MALLPKTKYKKYILDHQDIVNDIFKKRYPKQVFLVSKGEQDELLLTKTGSDGKLYTYDDLEDSLEFVDNYIKRYINFYLFTKKRHEYLLDVIKHVGSVDKAENILIETIQKGYID